MFFKVPREDAKYQAAFITRKHLSLPVSISTLLTLFEATIQEKKHAFKIFNNTNCDILNINTHLHQAFRNKTRIEKIDYYSQCVQYLSAAMKIEEYSDPKKQYLHPIVEANAYLKSKILGRWDKYSVKISLPNKKMVLTSNKTEIVVTLDKYYLRASKDSSRLSIVLQSIVDNCSHSELRIAFDQYFHTELKKILEELIWQAEQERFNKILREASSSELGSFIEQKTKFVSNGFLTEKVMDRFEDFKKRLLQNVNEPVVNKRFIINQGSKRLYIAKDTYYYEQLFFLSKDELLKVCKLPTDSWNPLVKEFSVVETEQDRNLEVIYEKTRIKDKLYDNIYLREDISTETEGRILNHGLKNNFRTNQNTQPLDFDYSLIRVLPISESESKLYIEVDMQFHCKQEHQFMSLLFSQLSKLYEVHLNALRQPKAAETAISSSQISLHTGNVRKPFEEVVVQLPKLDQQRRPVARTHSQTSSPMKAYSAGSCTDFESGQNVPSLPSIVTNSNSYLHHVFQLGPQQREQRTLEKQHYLWQDWQKIESGGIVCVNDKIISEQKKIFKHILASFGKNLFKMKGVLNISLPVGIFKRESHLATIARNYSYAPLLLEPRENQTTLERMKLVTIFLITIGTVGISMEKPFNPLLGETYQAWIDGCPIYLEQVSHHPPRSAYMLYGRGYKIYGQIEPRIELGMNSVKGYNQRENIIEFDDGAKISFSIPKMVIKGMLFGDRQFNFEDKNYIYDMSNHIFSEVIFGPRKAGGFFSKAEDPTDFVFGKVMRVAPEFYMRWKDKRKIWPNKDDVVQELSSYEGVWNESISFDGKHYFSFRNQLPCRLDHEQSSLLSDSAHRRDLQKLIQGNVQQAQKEKESIQQFQRRDRRLRQSHHKK